MQPQIQTISSDTQINYGSLLGKGSTGNVYEGILRNAYGQIPVAVKEIKLSTIDNEVTGYLLRC